MPLPKVRRHRGVRRVTNKTVRPSAHADWVTEVQTPALRFSMAVNEILYQGRSDYQDIIVADTKQFGRVLSLDGVFQTSDAEEWVYHEMIAHVPLYMHPHPERVLIIGGGDGGCAREVLRHAEVASVDMVEIDAQVIQLAKKYFPRIASALIEEPARLHLTVGDGLEKVASADNEYDVIIVDCSDPIGPGEGLFQRRFYQDACRALKKGGLLVQQTDSPFLRGPLVHDIMHVMTSEFAYARLYLAAIPIYPSGMHSFMVASKGDDPLTIARRPADIAPLRYYNDDIARAAFVLPNFVKTILRERPES